MNYVLDTSAVLAHLRDEPGAEVMGTLVFRSQASLYIHAVNALEIYYKLSAYYDEEMAGETLENLARSGVETHDTLPPDMLLRAGFFKGRYQFLSLADCVCFALAEHLSAELLTADRPFGKVHEGVRVTLIR